MQTIEAKPQVRASLARQLAQARRQTEELFAIIAPSFLYERPIAERHRLIFYFGHLDAFDYIQVCREAMGKHPFHLQFDNLFQRGIDPDSTQLPTDRAEDWPRKTEVEQYVRRCRAEVDAVLESAPEEALQMAAEHRLMHLETLAYMWHNFDYAAKVTPPADRVNEAPSYAPPPNDFKTITAGTAVLGKNRDGAFGWDNEYLQHVVEVDEFRIQRFKVTNGEYFEFVKQGGPKPHFWVERNGEIFYRGMFREIPLPLDWPVYVTQQQAQAYAATLGKRLPTEAQYCRAAFGTPAAATRTYPWGEAPPTRDMGNFDFKRWDPEPVDFSPRGTSAFGVEQLIGNGWEWTGTVFAPFQGFAPSTTYPGYSADFFDGEHFVMKGASPRTAAKLVRPSFRNWFRADYPYVYGTFRCVEG